MFMKENNMLDQVCLNKPCMKPRFGHLDLPLRDLRKDTFVSAENLFVCAAEELGHFLFVKASGP